MTHQAIMPINVDSTMIACFRACEEKLNLEFLYGLRPEGISIDLHAGASFASGIEAVRKAVFQKGRTLPEALAEGYAAFSIAWGDFEIPEHKRTGKTREQVWEAVEGYFAKWPPLTDHFQPYYIDGKPSFEWSFAIPLEPTADYLHADQDDVEGQKYFSYDPDFHKGYFPLHPSGDPWLYSGRFDMLGEYEGLPAFGDEKTTGSTISTGWADKWNLRNQFIGYRWAMRQHGLDCRGGLVRGISILKTKIDYQEIFKSYSDDLEARWFERLRRDMWKLRKAWDSGYFEPDFADACTSYGNCMFMNLCLSNKEMRQNWFNDFVVRRWNPLLKNPVVETKEAA